MKLRILGCSGGISAQRLTTSFMVDNDVLIDAGTGAGQLTLDEMAQIRHIFITHSHLDHIACLPLLIDSIFERITRPVTIHALPETIDALKQHIFNWVIWPDFAQLPDPEHPAIIYHPLIPGEVFTFNDRHFEMIPVNHVVPAVGYRVTHKNKTFVYSGDTTNNNSLWDALNHDDPIDLLIIESAFSNKDEALSQQAKHYCPNTLATDLKKLKHDTRVYLTHAKPGSEQAILAECATALSDFNIKALKGGEVFQL